MRWIVPLRRRRMLLALLASGFVGVVLATYDAVTVAGG